MYAVLEKREHMQSSIYFFAEGSASLVNFAASHEEQSLP